MGIKQKTKRDSEARKAKAYSYIRMSTPEQLKGSSLKRQLARTRDYAERHDLELIESFDDLGASAYRGKHADFGALSRFRALVDAGEIESGSYLVVESMDRLSREKVLSAFRKLAELIDRGIIVVTLDDGQIYSEDGFDKEHFKLYIALGSMARAHEESKRKSDLMSHTWAGKRKDLATDGTILTRRVPSWLIADKANKTIEPIPARVEVIQQIFAMTRDGYGIYSIASFLNRNGVKPWSTRKNAVWRDSYVKKILTSRTVLGEFQPHTTHVDRDRKRRNVPVGEPILNYYPAVISPQLFQEAAAATAVRRTKGKGRKGKTYSNLFTGLLRCSCSAGVRFVDKGKKRGKDVAYLRCSVALAGGACKSRGFRYDLIERKLLEHIESLDLTRVMGGAPRNQRLAEAKHARSMLEVDLEAVQKKIERIVAAVMSPGSVKTSSLTEALAALEKDRGALRTAIAASDLAIGEFQTVNPQERMRVFSDLLRKLDDSESPEDLEVTRRALASEIQRVIDSIVIARSFVSEVDLVDGDQALALEAGTTPSAGDEYADPSQRIEMLQTYQQIKANLSSYSFELRIRYRNGNGEVIEGWRARSLKFRTSERMKRLMTNARINAPSEES